MSQLAVKKHVWDILTDINSWSQWQTAVSSARATMPLSVGSTFVWKSGGLTITSTVQILEPNKRITWTGKSIGTDAKHTWIVQAQNEGTVAHTNEEMSGWLVGILKLVFPGFLEKSLDAWLLDLKNKAEIAS
jgi:hypothetical protein